MKIENLNSQPTSKGIKWKSFLSFNIVVLFFFWVGLITDYSWYDNWISILYSILVLFVSVTTLFMLTFLNKLQQGVVFCVCLLSFLMGGASILLHRYHSHQTPVQVGFSPDGKRFIEVYCSFTSAHNDGFDHIEIIVRHKSIPFLQRDLGLYNDDPLHCKFDNNILVRWEDNNTIYVIERQALIPVNRIKWEGVLSNPGEINGTD